ncbi:MAG: hypothetical protein MUP16_07135, partial [Sedimentisphaerales bacterium]|nr:hypothetical protein [Sedimentisphaerales bacterium]
MKSDNHIAKTVELCGGSLIAVIVGVWFTIIFGILPKEIGSYPAQKQGDGTLMPLNRTIYKVHPFTQTIIYW